MITVSIEVKDLTCSYGDIPALDAVSLQFRPGEIVALLGPNGAGKSTLISCLAGLRKPDSGEVTFNGKVLSPNDLDLRRQIGYIPDQPPLPSGLTVLYYVGLMVRLYEKEESQALEERVIALLDDFEMLPLAGRGLSELSRGQLYKAALVAHIAVDPPVWILDEPFASGMDPVGLMAFKDQARAAVARGRCVLFSTQILDVAEDVADRVCVLHKGSIVVEGTLAEVGAKSGDLERIFRRLKEGE